MHITDSPAQAFARLQGVVASKPEGYRYARPSGERYCSYFHPEGGCFVGEYFASLGMTASYLRRDLGNAEANFSALSSLVQTRVVTFADQDTYKLLRRVQSLQDKHVPFGPSVLTWAEVLDQVREEFDLHVEASLPLFEIAEGADKPVFTTPSYLIAKTTAIFHDIVAGFEAVPEEPAASEPSEEPAKELIAA